MKVNSSGRMERKGKFPNSKSENIENLSSNTILKTKDLNELTPQKIDNLSIEDLEFLREKYQKKHPKATIIGKKPFDSFLAGISGDT